MAITDITSDFHSYIQDTHINFNTSWNTSNFIKSANNVLIDMSILQSKLLELKKVIKSSSRFDKEKNNKMILNIKESIKIGQQSIKRLASVQPDIKGSSRIAKSFQTAVLSALELRLLKVSFEFKSAYEQNCLKSQRKSSLRPQSSTEQSQTQINLTKSHFLTQTQQQLIQQTSLKQYKEIEKSINDIFEMYKVSNDAVKLQGYMIDSIENNVQDIDWNVQEGKKNVSEVQKRQAGNRSMIIKMFTVLYAITFLYIVFLS